MNACTMKSDYQKHHGHRKWKRRRPHLLPVMHHTLRRWSWERARRHAAAGRVFGWTERCFSGGLYLASVAMAWILLLVICYFLMHAILG